MGQALWMRKLQLPEELRTPRAGLLLLHHQGPWDKVSWWFPGPSSPCQLDVQDPLKGSCVCGAGRGGGGDLIPSVGTSWRWVKYLHPNAATRGFTSSEHHPSFNIRSAGDFQPSVFAAQACVLAGGSCLPL